MDVAIVDYQAGNIFSVINALNRIGIHPILTDQAEVIAKADRVIFPGQGEASHAMRHLKEKGLDKVICHLRQPVLGICIGQQLLCSHSEEGDTSCLGIFPMEVRRFRPASHEDKVPAMGWNNITGLKGDLFRGIDERHAYVYFVHSYYVPISAFTIATADYIHPFSAAIRHKNFFATQFHPEKSGDVGEQILRNFIELETFPS